MINMPLDELLDQPYSEIKQLFSTADEFIDYLKTVENDLFEMYVINGWQVGEIISALRHGLNPKFKIGDVVYTSPYLVGQYKKHVIEGIFLAEDGESGVPEIRYKLEGSDNLFYEFRLTSREKLIEENQRIKQQLKEIEDLLNE